MPHPAKNVGPGWISRRAEMIIKLLCEGTSVRVASRLTDTSVDSILDLLVLVGERCKASMSAIFPRLAAMLIDIVLPHETHG